MGQLNIPYIFYHIIVYRICHIDIPDEITAIQAFHGQIGTQNYGAICHQQS
jgi:hypothetical protein